MRSLSDSSVKKEEHCALEWHMNMVHWYVSTCIHKACTDIQVVQMRRDKDRCPACAQYEGDT